MRLAKHANWHGDCICPGSCTAPVGPLLPQGYAYCEHCEEDVPVEEGVPVEPLLVHGMLLPNC